MWLKYVVFYKCNNYENFSVDVYFLFFDREVHCTTKGLHRQTSAAFCVDITYLLMIETPIHESCQHGSFSGQAVSWTAMSNKHLSILVNA